LVTLAVADLVATATIFLFSMALNNSSLYDPYWSVAPIFIVGFYLLRLTGRPPLSTAALLRCWITAVLVAAWGSRLTLNWITRWKGLKDEDWRYRGFRASSGSWYWPVSFLGIHLFPTVIVYLGCLSLYPVYEKLRPSLSALDVAATLVTAGAITIETLADLQLRRFVRNPQNSGAPVVTGLWRYSRHPNYFGEVLFWWGLFLFAAAQGWKSLWVAIGAVAMTLLFVFASIPMMERRLLKTRRNYREATRGISSFIPWFPPSRLEP
jgi:steroid 5-alpha reductase family enzyme